MEAHLFFAQSSSQSSRSAQSAVSSTSVPHGRSSATARTRSFSAVQLCGVWVRVTS